MKRTVITGFVRVVFLLAAGLAATGTLVEAAVAGGRTGP